MMGMASWSLVSGSRQESSFCTTWQDRGLLVISMRSLDSGHHRLEDPCPHYLRLGDGWAEPEKCSVLAHMSNSAGDVLMGGENSGGYGLGHHPGT